MSSGKSNGRVFMNAMFVKTLFFIGRIFDGDVATL
jgi:hypothetical protein